MFYKKSQITASIIAGGPGNIILEPFFYNMIWGFTVLMILNTRKTKLGIGRIH